MEDLGLDEYVGPASVLAIEWPERAYQRVLQLDVRKVIEIDLEVADEDTRLIRIRRTDVLSETKLSATP